MTDKIILAAGQSILMGTPTGTGAGTDTYDLKHLNQSDKTKKKFTCIPTGGTPTATVLIEESVDGGTTWVTRATIDVSGPTVANLDEVSDTLRFNVSAIAATNVSIYMTL